ncbi:AIPR protein [Pseudoxanthomonas sp. 3HH-4]|uniref:AIPR family protein n=1 Tax=Pseudoxanthomonas sp. 3HH-4 TaxID=1690214 RepID=UPI001151220B|nr:AIPR family protein [Pseudoxanthomonas sp. 3HH-4]TQM18063.1 AIPR protein [Pseudoxanthomonas sp. 3HH-4]
MAGTTSVSASGKSISADPRKEMLAAIDAVAKRGGITRDRAITAWYAATLLGIDEDDAIDAASVDGPEDGGCDFIYIDHDQEVVYVLQGYVSDRTDRSAGIKKWNALVAAVANVKDPVSFRHGGRHDIYETLTEIDVSDYSLVFGLVTLAAKSDQISRQRETATRSKAYGSDAAFFYEYQESLYDKFLVVRAADRNVLRDTLSFVGAVAEVKGEFGQAIVGAVPASELYRLHEKYKNQLFEGNVRLFIGERKGGINEKIVETAQARPGDFWALNNGITIVADSFDRLRGSSYEISRFSIVNGCQTTASLSRAIERAPAAGKAQVLVRVVGAKKALLTDIVRYNNTQNPVKLSAVRLLDPIQEGLRNAFSVVGYLYAPKQEGAKTVKSPNRIELDRITQYLAAMSDDTILEAVAKKVELFDRSYKSIFPRGLKAERVMLAWLLAQEVEIERASLLEAADVTSDAVMKAILGIHGTPWGIYVANTIIDRSGSDLSKLTLNKMVSPDFRFAIAKYAKRAMELYSEIAVNIVDTSDASSSTRNELRTKPFLDKLKRTLSLRMAKISSWKLPKLHSVSN